MHMAARFFNTAGPVNPQDHYCLPPLERFDLDDVLSLIQQKKYFILYAPRQTGKTSALFALMEHLNNQGSYRCVYMNVEAAQAAREDVAAAMQAMRGELASWSRSTLDDSFVDDCWGEALSKYGPYGVFGEVLSRWAAHDVKPLILLIDEYVSDLLRCCIRTRFRQFRWSTKPR